MFYRHMAKVLLGEIGHSPGPELEFAVNRESYSLSAGMALGMITLGVSRTHLSYTHVHAWMCTAWWRGFAGPR